MAPRRSVPQETPPDVAPEKAYKLLSAQLEKLNDFKNLNYQQAEQQENEWFQLTQKLVLRSFGSGSSNHKNFSYALSAGEHFITPAFGWDGSYAGADHDLNQSNFLARIAAYENALKSSIAELRMDLPEDEIKGVYEPGQEYEFYADVKSRLVLSQNELFVIDPYLSTEIFDVYAASIPRTVLFRLLGTNISAVVLALAQKYASGGNLQFRVSAAIHDRVIFVDKRAWVCGQSLKDAAKKKPTYIVEVDKASIRPGYEAIWAASQVMF